MNTKEYEIFKVKMKIQEIKKTISLLEDNKEFYLFNAQKASFFKLEQNESWEKIRQLSLEQAKKELNEAEKKFNEIN